ncbi:MAG: hypothetical protein ABWZ30_00995 [Jiangellaceae bacterium]
MTETSTAAFHVHTIGPNLPREFKYSYHVHAKGCPDVRRNPLYQSREFAEDRTYVYDVDSLTELSAIINADVIGEDEDPDSYLGEFKVFPCVGDLPRTTPESLMDLIVRYGNAMADGSGAAEALGEIEARLDTGRVVA